MRGILFLILIFVVYYAIKTVLRSAAASYREEHHAAQQKGIQGEEMVQDPYCRTYVVKNRALSRRINGKVHYFCSEACAQRYEESLRG